MDPIMSHTRKLFRYMMIASLLFSLTGCKEELLALGALYIIVVGYNESDDEPDLYTITQSAPALEISDSIQIATTEETIYLTGSIFSGRDDKQWMTCSSDSSSSPVIITWTNDTTGTSGTARYEISSSYHGCSGYWLASFVPLVYGENALRVTAISNMGVSNTDSLTITRSFGDPISYNVNYICDSPIHPVLYDGYAQQITGDIIRTVTYKVESLDNGTYNQETFKYYDGSTLTVTGIVNLTSGSCGTDCSSWKYDIDVIVELKDFTTALHAYSDTQPAMVSGVLTYKNDTGAEYAPFSTTYSGNINISDNGTPITYDGAYISDNCEREYVGVIDTFTQLEAHTITDSLTRDHTYDLYYWPIGTLATGRGTFSFE